MDISVIVTIYNAEKYIEKSLTSLFSQTKTTNVEYILVNDATPDNSMLVTKTIIANYPNCNINIIDLPYNQGVAAARSIGLRYAKGKYTIYADSDDYFELTMLEDLYNTAIENDADIVICDYFLSYNERKTIYKTQNIKGLTNDDIIKKFLTGDLHGALWNKLIRRDLYNKYAIDFAPNINIWEDMLICTNLLLKEPYVVYYPRAYVHYIQRPYNSITNNISINSLKEMVKVVDVIYKLINKNSKAPSFSQEINILKMSVKKEWLIHKNKEIIKLGITLYKETDNYINIYPKTIYRNLLNLSKFSGIYGIIIYGAIIRWIKKIKMFILLNL